MLKLKRMPSKHRHLFLPKLISFFLLLILTLFTPPTIHAQSASTGTDAYCTPGDPTSGVQTALGCISTEATGVGFFGQLINIIIGISGGLALVMMLFGTFIVTTSAGMPDKLKEGQEILTSAIAGLLFIILSVFLLQFIGITVLGLPGFK